MVQARVNDFWKEKIGLYVMQVDYLALIMEEGSCITWRSYLWAGPSTGFPGPYTSADIGPL